VRISEPNDVEHHNRLIIGRPATFGASARYLFSFTHLQAPALAIMTAALGSLRFP